MFDTSASGPYYEDFTVGATLPPLPAITLSGSDNTVYRAITGDQHAMSADRDAFRKASGGSGELVNPALIVQYSIGQTTMATRQAIANLYYRSVRVLRPVVVGETMSTVTTVLGLKDSAPKGDQYRGKVWLGIRSTVAAGTVVEYERCALVRGRGPDQPGHADDIPGPSEPTPLADLESAVPDWDLRGLRPTAWPVGDERSDPLRDHVDLAAPLARLTFNQAAVHRDVTTTADGRRLVYGGHVQGLAQASLSRMLPGLACVVAWDGCDHIGPAYEGDLVEFRHRLVERSPAGAGELMRLEVTGSKIDPASRGGSAGGSADILRWTPIVWAV